MNPQVPGDGLLLASLALKLQWITSAQLAHVLEQWSQDPAQSLERLFIEGGMLTAADWVQARALLAQESGLASSPLPRDGQRATLDPATIRTLAGDKPEDATRTVLQTLADRGDSFGSLAASISLTELNRSNQRFRLLRRHAVGGLGMVSVAHDAELDREVAIKEMRLDSPSEDAIGRFLMEARVTGQLDHPGIPPVYAVGYFDDGRPFYAMRLIDGTTLKDAVTDFHSRFPPPDVSSQRSLELRKLLGAFVSVCHTLRYAHSRNVLHRDIKPSNIMLGGFGETLVLDWGLAKSKEQSLPYSAVDAKAHQSLRRGDDPALTGTGSVMGTPHYMSPEQARGAWESVNLRSEVYSLGATLYTLLTGKLPFSGSTRDAVLEQVRSGQFVRPRLVDPRIPPELDAICVKAMALEREDRFANAGELASEIEHWLADEPIGSYRETASRRWQRWFRSHQTAVAAMVVLLVTGMLALGVGMVFVSIEHRLARAEQKRAEEERARAEVAEKLASDFVSKFLVISTNNKLGDVAGSEGPRLELLNDAVAQLTAWAQAEPDSRQRSYALAEALRERSLLFATTGQLDEAWADIDRAVECIDRIGPQSRHPSLLPVRLIAISQMADLIAQRDGAAAAIRFVQPYQLAAEKLFHQNPSDAKAVIALVVVSLSHAKSLVNLDRAVEAAELIDAAVTRCETLRSNASESSVSRVIYDARQTLAYVACVARSLEAQVAAMLGDREFARECIEQARRLCDAALEDAPDAVEPWKTKLELLVIECEMKGSRATSARELQTVRRADRMASEAAERFPRNRELTRLCGRIALLHAEQELDDGDFARAAQAAARALGLIRRTGRSGGAGNTAHDKQFNDAWAVQAERLSAEIAWLEGNGSAAWIHCQAARDALWNCDSEAFATGELASELALVELIEAQTLSASPSTAGPSKLLE